MYIPITFIICVPLSRLKTISTLAKYTVIRYAFSQVFRKIKKPNIDNTSYKYKIQLSVN